MAIDSFDACTNELMSFVPATKRLAPTVAVTDGPALERPALILLYRIVENGPMRPSALAELVHADLSTVSRQLAGLESSGWVSRERDPDDRRASLVRATAEGQRVLKCNMAARKTMLRELLIDWTETERLEFARLLGRLNTTLGRSHAGGCPTPASE